MAHGPDVRNANLLFEPVDQKIRRRTMIGSFDAKAALLTPERIVESQIRPGCANAVNFSNQLSHRWFANLIQRELDARRAAVDR